MTLIIRQTTLKVNLKVLSRDDTFRKLNRNPNTIDHIFLYYSETLLIFRDHR